MVGHTGDSKTPGEEENLILYHGDELVIQSNNLITYSVIFLAMLLSQGYFS